MNPKLPFKTRHEFTENRRWGAVSPGLRRLLLVRPQMLNSSTLTLRGAVGAAHSGRCTLLLWVTGGHLAASYEEIAAAAASRAALRLEARAQTPGRQVKALVSWLESQQTSGLLRRAYVTASLAVVVDDKEIWVWHSSPHGAMCGPLQGLKVRSTDLRMPTLRRMGLLPARAASSRELQLIDNLSSVFCVGTPHGYEELRCEIGMDRSALVFDRASLPFGPMSGAPLPLPDVWRREAGWRLGLPAQVLAIGNIATVDLALPRGWCLEEHPLGD